MNVPPRARLVIAGILATAAVIGITHLALRHPNAAEIEGCRFVTADDAARSAERWRARSRGEDGPPSENGLARVGAACAPIYSEPACAEAWRHAGEGDPATRLSTLVNTCKEAYCPKLDAPKPALCNGDPRDLRSFVLAWDELDDTIVKHDLGMRAGPLLDARARGRADTKSAVEGYLDAGSPPWSTEAGSMRAIPTDGGH